MLHALFVMGISGWFIYKNSEDVVMSTFLFSVEVIIAGSVMIIQFLRGKVCKEDMRYFDGYI